MTRFRMLGRAAAAGVLALALTGCVKLDMDLAVQSDDTVDGSVVFGLSKSLAGLPGVNPGDLTGAPIDKPEQGKVTTKKYDDGDFLGTQMDFTDVPLSEFGKSSGGDDLTIKREGDQFTVSGVLDLSGQDTGTDTSGMDLAALASSAKIRVRIAFPGEVVSANGAVDGNAVTWTPKFGEKVEIRAVAKAKDGGFPLSTALIAGGLLVGLVAVGGFLILSMRRRGSTPVAPPVDGFVPAAALVGGPVVGEVVSNGSEPVPPEAVDPFAGGQVPPPPGPPPGV